MHSPPPLTDRPALLRNRRRFAATFLHQAVADELQERLNEVNRPFTRPAIVTGLPDFWAAQMPGALIVPDDDVLVLTGGAHDLAIHALSLHWANDPVGQLVQCRHALAADGLLIAVLFGGQTLHELRAVLAEAETRVTGGMSPRIAPMGEIRDLGGLLQRAGLALPVADTTQLTVSYAGLPDLMHDLRAMGEGNAISARLRRPTGRAVFEEARRIYHAAFGTPDGAFRQPSISSLLRAGPRPQISKNHSAPVQRHIICRPFWEPPTPIPCAVAIDPMGKAFICTSLKMNSAGHFDA